MRKREENYRVVEVDPKVSKKKTLDTGGGKELERGKTWPE